jgi:hypothetical protein
MLRAFKRTGVRTINLDAFRNALRGTPKGNVELWVTVEDGDAHQYGLDIQSALRLSGWNVSEIKRLPPETKPIWESMVVRCGKLPHWDLRSTPRTNGEALQKALMMGTDWNNNPLWMEPDQTLSDGNFVIEVHPQTPTEKQYNSSEQ